MRAKLLGRTCGGALALAAAVARADPPEAAPDDPIYFDGSVPPVAAIDCEEHQDVGYVQGEPFDITVVTVDGKPVEVQTANAYYAMQQAAAKDGVGIKIVSGFRTMAEQQYLYNCYVTCSCNNCNLAAKPGYSNHQSGHALDLNTGAAGVMAWLNAHGEAFGFSATVPSEAWHWEWWGGGPPTSGPCGTPAFRAEYVAQSFPPAAAPPVLLEVGACTEAWIDLRNTGDAGWDADTWLAPTPREQPSPLVDLGTWSSETRVATAGSVAPGAVGRFAFRLCAHAAGEVVQTFGLVQEGVTWFADAPLGGGPPDTQLAVRVLAVDPPPPLPGPPPLPSPPQPLPPPPPAAFDTSGGEGDGGTTGPSGDATGAEEGAGESVESGCDCRGASGPGGLALLGLLLRRRRGGRRVLSATTGAGGPRGAAERT